MTKTVRDVMMPDPWAVDAGLSLEDTAHLMRAWDVREILVIDDGRLCGSLTDSDIAFLAISSGRKPSRITAGECADPRSPRLDIDQPAGRALEYMRRHSLRRVPVVDGSQLVGSATVGDLAIAADSRPRTAPGPRHALRGGDRPSVRSHFPSESPRA